MVDVSSVLVDCRDCYCLCLWLICLVITVAIAFEGRLLVDVWYGFT